jgi:xylulose-5-phosphate/fructose-6-phosphate phosphoketolase
MEVTDRHAYIRQHGEDMPEIREWKWPTASLTPA